MSESESLIGGYTTKDISRMQEITNLYIEKTNSLERMWKRADILGIPDKTQIRPNETTTLQLSIPFDYFNEIGLSQEQTPDFLRFMLSFGRYSLRSTVAQAGGAVEPNIPMGTPITAYTIDKTISDWHINTQFRNINRKFCGPEGNRTLFLLAASQTFNHLNFRPFLQDLIIN